MNCKICTEKYDKKERRPLVLLPCAHTFCNKCIDQLKSSTKYSCHKCKKKVHSEKLNDDLLELIDMNLIVDVNADLRQAIHKSLKEINRAKSRLQSESEERLLLINNRFKSIKSEIAKRTDLAQINLLNYRDELVRDALKLQQDLCHKIELVADETNFSLDSTTNIDKLERNELNSFKSILDQLKKDLDEKLNQLGQIEYNLEFIPNQTVDKAIIGCLTDLCSMKLEDILQKAESTISRADEQDTKKNHSEAFVSYQEAIDLFRKAIKSDDSSVKEKQLLKEKCNLYLRKVNKLQNIMALCDKFKNVKKVKCEDEEEKPALLKKKRIDDDNDDDEDLKHDIKKKKMNQINEYHGVQDYIKNLKRLEPRAAENTSKTDSRGLIEIEELEYYIEKIARNLFHHFDENQMGLINFTGFKQIIDIFTMPEPAYYKDLKASYEKFDTDDDGKINLTEFMALFKQYN